MARAFLLFDAPGKDLPVAYASGILMLGVVHWLAYQRTLGHQIERIPDWAFAFGYGAAVTLVLPFVQIEYQPFIYFQF